MNIQPKSNDLNTVKTHVMSIVEGIEKGITYEESGIVDDDSCNATDGISGLDYIADVLDIEYIINGGGEYVGGLWWSYYMGRYTPSDSRRRMVGRSPHRKLSHRCYGHRRRMS